MKSISILCLFGLTLIAGCRQIQPQEQIDIMNQLISEERTESVLRHVVLFNFKEEATSEQIKEVEEAFEALPAKIPEIKAFEWGTNNSPEGLDKGHTHCFLLTFLNEEDRDAYLPHPDHKAFGEIVGPVLEDVTVIDYWTETE